MNVPVHNLHRRFKRWSICEYDHGCVPSKNTKSGKSRNRAVSVAAAATAATTATAPTVVTAVATVAAVPATSIQKGPQTLPCSFVQASPLWIQTLEVLVQPNLPSPFTCKDIVKRVLAEEDPEQEPEQEQDAEQDAEQDLDPEQKQQQKPRQKPRSTQRVDNTIRTKLAHLSRWVFCKKGRRTTSGVSL